MRRAEHATLRHAAHRSSAGVDANDARPAADARIFAPRGAFRATATRDASSGKRHRDRSPPP